MKIFLIRHGKSQDDEDSKSQRPDTPLSKIGLKQAEVLAKSLKDEKIDVIFSSHYPRAFETAKIIAKHLNKHVETSKLIHEREKHPSIYGVEMGTVEFNEYKDSIIAEGKNLDWKHKGKGESTRDVIKRATKFRNHLIKNHSNQTLIVVSHGNFMRCFIGLCIFGEDYDDNSFAKFYSSLRFKNTGVSIIEYNNEKGGWEVISINDFSHLRLVGSPLLK